MSAAISIKNLKKHFAGTKAVDGISFEVERGEIFGFLGPNGAGKTTTIRCLMDYLRPTSGHIKILGLDAQSDSVQLKSKLGYLAPEPRLYDYLTGLEHIELIEKIRGKGEKTAELIDRLGADVKVRVKNLSTGNKQKISLILVLMNNPDVVIMDEPTTGLDPLLQNTIYEILLEMKDVGKTIFMSSHNLSEVEKICQRVAIIRSGKLISVENIKNLNKKKLYRVRLVYQDHQDIEGIEKIKDVKIEAQTPVELHFTVSGDIEPVIKYLAGKRIGDLEITHASLEETFIDYYKGGGK